MNKSKSTNPDYSTEVIKCPCCGQTDVELWDICDVCGWENDDLQHAEPDLRGGANTMSLNEARAAFRAGKPAT